MKKNVKDLKMKNPLNLSKEAIANVKKSDILNDSWKKAISEDYKLIAELEALIEKVDLELQEATILAIAARRCSYSTDVNPKTKKFQKLKEEYQEVIYQTTKSFNEKNRKLELLQENLENAKVQLSYHKNEAEAIELLKNMEY